jgi:hypothetical protein
MKNLVVWRILSTLAVLPTLAICQGQGTSVEAEASSLVQKFAQFDFEGYRLGSEGHQAIWKLTIDDGAPPEFPMVIIRGFKVAAPTKAADGSLRVSVDYDVVGLVSEGANGLTLRLQPGAKKEIFPVKCLREGCRIDLDRGVFHISPHIGKEAALMWLKTLESFQDTAQERQPYQRLYEQVRSAK